MIGGHNISLKVAHSHVIFKVGCYSYCCCLPYSRLLYGHLYCALPQYLWHCCAWVYTCDWHSCTGVLFLIVQEGDQEEKWYSFISKLLISAIVKLWVKKKHTLELSPFRVPKSLILSQLLITWLRKVETALLYGREGKYLNLFDFQTIPRTLLKSL